MSEKFISPFGSSWIPDDAPPQGERAALLRLAAALRTCTELMMDTAASADELEAAAEAAEAFTARLGQAPRKRPLWGWAETSTSGDARAMFDSSPIIGLANPVAAPLRLAVVDDHVEGTATFGRQYEGPPGHVHGGFIAAAFDEALGMAQSLSGAGGMTGRLVVNYRSPTPLYTELRFVGRLDRRDGRKIYTSGTLMAGEKLCAEAEALFISIDFQRMRGLAKE